MWLARDELEKDELEKDELEKDGLATQAWGWSAAASLSRWEVAKRRWPE